MWDRGDTFEFIGTNIMVSNNEEFLNIVYNMPHKDTLKEILEKNKHNTTQQQFDRFLRMQQINEDDIRKHIKDINIVAINYIIIGDVQCSFGEDRLIFQTIKFTSSNDKYYSMTIRPDMLGSVCFTEIIIPEEPVNKTFVP